MKRKIKSNDKKKIAKERITILFAQAIHADKDFANRYMIIAHKIAMKAQVRLTSEQRRRICKHCYAYLKPSITSRIRLHKAKLVQFCHNCRKFNRMPYIKEIKAKRQLKAR